MVNSNIVVPFLGNKNNIYKKKYENKESEKKSPKVKKTKIQKKTIISHSNQYFVKKFLKRRFKKIDTFEIEY